MAKRTQQTTQTQALVKWDEELAKQAQLAAGMEDSTATGQFFSLKGGILSFNDMPMPNNQMAVIILDGILENLFYEYEYDPENPAGPTCFAFGRSEQKLAPHKVVQEAGTAQCESCANCKNNEWGSADKGRGKACRNTRRLAMIPAGELDANGKFTLGDIELMENSGLAFMRLPVTSVKGYAGFVKQVAGVLKRPPFGIITKVRVQPDPKTQFKVVFEPIQSVPDELIALVMKRHDEAKAVIDFPYTPAEEPAAKQPAPRGRGNGRPAQRGRKY